MSEKYRISRKMSQASQMSKMSRLKSERSEPIDPNIHRLLNFGISSAEFRFIHTNSVISSSQITSGARHQ